MFSLLLTLTLWTSQSVAASDTWTPFYEQLNPRALCPTGQYSATGNTPCFSCLAGSYASSTGSTSCTLASPGYYVPTSGASSQTACPQGTYSSTSGAIACTTCPAGTSCQGTGNTQAVNCPAGQYSSGSGCTNCPAGTFTSVSGSSSCCTCCANSYQNQAGQTSCKACPDSKPYGPPGLTSPSSCVASPHLYASSTCQQAADKSCPNPAPLYSDSGSPRRRALEDEPKCRVGQKACKVPGGRGFECISILSDLESCGGCVDPLTPPGGISKDGGRDCSSIPHVGSVECSKGTCIIESCKIGYVLSSDRQSCIRVR